MEIKENSSNSVFIKIIIVGDSGVGKTSLLNQYCYGKFSLTEPTTLGCDFQTKIIESGMGQTLKLQLWDIAGQEKFKSITRLYVRGALGCVIISDITDFQSLQSTVRWKQMIYENCELMDDQMQIPIILVQNKCDLVKNLGQLEDYMTMEYARNFSQEQGFIDVCQVSAKDNFQLDDIFNRLTSEIISRGLIEQNDFRQFPNNNNNKNTYNRPSALRKDQQQQKSKKSGCC